MKKLFFLVLLLTVPALVMAQASGGQIKRKEPSKKTTSKLSSPKKKAVKYTLPIPQLIDMGLPSGTLWADRNLGANVPEDKGYEYPWGETVPGGISNKFLDKGILKGNIYSNLRLNLQNDAAYINLGSSWCMPTYAQIKELINPNYTEVNWTAQNSVYGLRIRSRYNGNIIFLPTTGNNSDSDYGYYWTSDIDRQDNRFAYSLVFNRDGILSVNNGMISIGRFIRPVSINKR